MSELRPDQSMISCLDNVRRMDHDRYLTALLAPSPARGKLIALYAFNAEIARVREMVSEPMLGQIRLQWWREALEGIAQGEVRGHEAAVGLAEAFSAEDLDVAGLTALIDARERDLDDEPFADMTALNEYCSKTSSGLMRLAARALSPHGVADDIIDNAGIGYALTGLLRALPVHASQGRLYLPLDLLGQHNVDPHTIFAGEMSDGLRAIIGVVAAEARERLKAARAVSPNAPRNVLAALWPASLCDAYLDRITAPGFDPFRQAVEVPVFRRQLRLLGRKFAGRF
ncbi:MAG: phytoene/squalene synthase family protein [Parvibaculum sp.]|nr:phytoene/squalene synthase family protein [Parvibaculum sp.]